MSTQTTTKKCEACTYWKPNAMHSDGECRRHAPQTIVFNVSSEAKYESRFPVTKAADWCGDFSAK